MKCIPWALALALGGVARAQLVVEEPPIVASDAANGLGFGFDLAVDGDELYVGAPHELGKSPLAGAIYRYRLDPGGWTEVEKIQPTNSYLGDRFGISVATDGVTLVGLTWSVPVGIEAVIFELQAGLWTQVERILVTTVVFSGSRPSVDVSGAAIAIGSPRNFTGESYVIQRTGADWTQHSLTEIAPPGVFGDDGYGSDVCFDGTRLAIGAPEGFIRFEEFGLVFVFEPDLQGNYAFVESIEPPIPESDGEFGYTVQLEGDRLFAGRPANFSSGAVDVLRKVGATWQLEQSIFPANPTDFYRFGESFAYAEGRLVIGAPNDGLGGAAYFYTEENGSFVLRERIEPAAAAPGREFATDVAIGPNRLLVGAPGADELGSFAGAVHSFVVGAPAPTSYCTAKVASDGCVPTIGSSGTASSTGSDDFVVDCTNTAVGKTGLFFFGTNGPVAVPFLGGTLCVLPPLVRTLPQLSGGAGTCGGSFTFGFGQALFEAEGVTPGDGVHGQWWLRDPAQPDGTGVALSDGLSIVFGI